MMRFKEIFGQGISYAAWAVAVVVILLLYRFVYSPTISALTATFKDINAKTNDIKTGARIMANRDFLLTQAGQLKSDFDYYQRRIATDASPNKMLGELTSLTEHMRINIIGIEPLPVVTNEITGVAGYYVQMPLRMRLKCGYHELGMFLADIEKSSNLMKVEELKITDDPQDIWYHNIEVVISAYAYTSK